jgi:hypothetical protein
LVAEQIMNNVGSEVEKQAIQNAILEYYHQGHITCDPELYKNILHPDWKFFLFDQGQLRIADRDEYCSWYNPENANPELTWDIEFYSVDVTENIAAVKLRLECQEVRYIDYFNMMKIDGKWWIVHKMSHGVHSEE